MGLLRDIQSNVVSQGTDIGSILLQVRLLAARLGSVPLEEWVKHESEGYPKDSPLPDYRCVPVAYTGTFLGPFGSGIKNAPIPPFLIEKFAGKGWLTHDVRESISSIEQLLSASASNGQGFHITPSNLILALQGKIYADYACNSVTGELSRGSLVNIQQAVRSRVLELTIKLEKSIPDSLVVDIESSQLELRSNASGVTQIANQVVYGSVLSISNSGQGARFDIAISPGDNAAFIQSLVGLGIPEPDAKDIGTIVATETPESSDEPFGPKAKAWLAENLKKAASGVWKIGVSVATAGITEAALRYYGLK